MYITFFFQNAHKKYTNGAELQLKTMTTPISVIHFSLS